MKRQFRLALIVVFAAGSVAFSPDISRAQDQGGLLDDIGDTDEDDEDLDDLDDEESLDIKVKAPPPPKTDPKSKKGTLGDEKKSTLTPKKEQKQKSVRDIIKSVPRKPILKRRRFEFTGTSSLSLNDAYYQHVATGGGLTYWLHNAFGVGVRADWFFAHLRSDNLDVVRRSLISVPAVMELPRAFLLGELNWVPFYGKISLFDTNIIHFEVYTVAGVGAATPMDGTYSPSATFALGQRYILSDWMSLKFEVRDYIYVSSQEVDSHIHSDIQNYIMFNAGISIFFPFSFEYTYL
ncbi:outer membrane beta-barrel domain-containing protein [Myxococcota bacterium]|nr:outer membrane beta-barrel domain-containing protein [Myxococcota bacterium]